MRHRALPLALLVAASLTPVAGCSDRDTDSNTDSPQDLAAEQVDSAPSDATPLPVNDPGAARIAQEKPAEPQPDAQAQKLAELQQRIRAMSQAADKRTQRLDTQAQRITKLEDTVDELTTRLRRLPQPNRASKPDEKNQQREQNPKNQKNPQDPSSTTPDAVSPQADNDGQARESQTDPDGDPGGDGDSADDDESSPATADAPAPPADAIGACSSHPDRGYQFDVFFQGETDNALKQAVDVIKAEQLSDWFAVPAAQRLYLGRYNHCTIATERRDTVHQATDLSLFIAAAQAQRAQAPEPTQTARSESPETTGYGASAHSPSTDSRVSTPSAASAPFRLIGVELRGTHRFLGVASGDAIGMDAITWLSAGDRYAGWQLRAIRTNTGRALFTQGDRTIALPLPEQG